MSSPGQHHRDERATEYLAAVTDKLSRSAGAETAERFVAYGDALARRGLPILFSVQQLAYVVGLRQAEVEELATKPEEHYTRFRLSKRSGGSRLIEAPSLRLKHVQRWIQRNITCRLVVSDHAHGFRRGRSIATNAQPHLRAKLLVKHDLKDFFGSIDRARVERQFAGLGYSARVSAALADLCVLRGALPQGAPTSPDLANAVALPLDEALARFVHAREIAYTRYADDLTFSGGLITAVGSRREIERIIERSGFSLNPEKTRLLSPITRQSVTGVVVNDRLNWPRDRRRWLRQEIHFLERFGVEAHLRARDYRQANYKEHIYGHVMALNAVRPDEGGGLLTRLDALDWPY